MLSKLPTVNYATIQILLSTDCLCNNEWGVRLKSGKPAKCLYCTYYIKKTLPSFSNFIQQACIAVLTSVADPVPQAWIRTHWTGSGSGHKGPDRTIYLMYCTDLNESNFKNFTHIKFEKCQQKFTSILFVQLYPFL